MQDIRKMTIEQKAWNQPKKSLYTLTSLFSNIVVFTTNFFFFVEWWWRCCCFFRRLLIVCSFFLQESTIHNTRGSSTHYVSCRGSQFLCCDYCLLDYLIGLCVCAFVRQIHFFLVAHFARIFYAHLHRSLSHSLVFLFFLFFISFIYVAFIKPLWRQLPHPAIFTWMWIYRIYKQPFSFCFRYLIIIYYQCPSEASY